eukprot:GHUV01037317.1.p1 GENE.GHUV01037317.1~~GHUV01037317.1.p1  ORF type:complete len:170 (+),score=32.52 GHUV01037317.1:960-1469(+)
MDTSVHLQNFFLYFYGMCFNLLGALAVCVYKKQTFLSIFDHQTKVTLFLVLNNALQGILSSFFYKFADTILKKYSSTIATIFTAIMSWAMFGHHLTANFLIGVSIVFVSMHQFFTFGDKAVAGQKVPVHQADRPITPGMVYSPSMDHIRVSDEKDVVVGDHGRALLLPR